MFARFLERFVDFDKTTTKAKHKEIVSKIYQFDPKLLSAFTVRYFAELTAAFSLCLY